MYSCDDTPKGWVAPFGHPRINACSRLPVAFRSVPRPSSPPGAKASTECPYRARDRRPDNPSRNRQVQTHHTQHASVSRQPPIRRNLSTKTADNRQPKTDNCTAGHSLSTKHIASERTARLQTSPHPPRGRQTSIGQTSGNRTRPETHQNLIHHDKDQPSPQARRPKSPQTQRVRRPEGHNDNTNRSIDARAELLSSPRYPEQLSVVSFQAPVVRQERQRQNRQHTNVH
jgi:hypothetical protein